MVALHRRLDQAWAAGWWQAVAEMARMRGEWQRMLVAAYGVAAGKLPRDRVTNHRTQGVFIHTASV
jgi:hypothetical protein